MNNKTSKPLGTETLKRLSETNNINFCLNPGTTLSKWKLICGHSDEETCALMLDCNRY